MRWQVRASLFQRRLDDGGSFIVDSETGNSVQINAAATAFLGMAARGYRLDEMCQRFAQRYRIKAEQAAADLRAIGLQLEQLGLCVRESSAPASATQTSPVNTDPKSDVSHDVPRS